MNIKWSDFIRLTKDNVRKVVPTSPGVYLLWVQLKSEKWRCYYVGRAANLEERLLSHLSSKEPNDCIKDNVRDHISGLEYAKVAAKSDREGIEKYLYDYFSPECNEIDPGGKPISVNIP